MSGYRIHCSTPEGGCRVQSLDEACLPPSTPIVVIIGSLGFVLTEERIYVRLLSPSRLTRK